MALYYYDVLSTKYPDNKVYLYNITQSHIQLKNYDIALQCGL